MLQQYLMHQPEITLGWGFFLPLAIMVVLILLAVRVWVVVGIGSLSMLYFTKVLPLSLLGEALFDGIDSFALIAVPLFILTGDILVRTGLPTSFWMLPKPPWVRDAQDWGPPQCWDAAFLPASAGLTRPMQPPSAESPFIGWWKRAIRGPTPAPWLPPAPAPES